MTRRRPRFADDRPNAMNDWKVVMARLAPGLATLRGYRLDWLRHDLVAGVSVAAVALPMAIAYAELAGFPA